MHRLSEILPNVLSMQISSSVRKCPHCGKKLEPITVTFKGYIFYASRRCECEILRYEEKERERKESEFKARIARFFDMRDLGERHADSSFDNFVLRPGTEKCYQAAKEFADNIDENLKRGRGLIILGAPGNGKTHLLAAVGHVAEQRGKTVVIRSVPALLKKIKSSYDKDTRYTEDDLLDVLREVQLLGLDDLGAEYWTKWTEPTLYYLIDERYRWPRSIIVTSNASIDELEERIGSRTLDRLCEMCDIIENRATSYRMELAMNRAQGVKTICQSE